MRVFIHKVIRFFLIFSAVILGVLAYLTSTFRFLPSPMYYPQQMERAYEKASADIVALGNSKMLASYVPHVMDTVLGGQTAMLATMSADMRTSDLLLEHYLDKAQHLPRLVIMEVSWFSFNTGRTNLHKITGGLFLEDPWNGLDLLGNKEVRSHISKAVQDQLRAKIRPSKKQWFRKNYPWDSDVKTIPFDTAHFELLFPDHKAGIEQQQLEAFLSILQQCKEREIPVLLYTAPEHEVFVRMQLDRMEVRSIFEKAAEDPSVHFLDYSWGNPLYRPTFDGWFLDSHHLHKSREFTEILAKQIIDLGLHPTGQVDAPE